MNDKTAVAQRTQQLMVVIRNVLVSQGANMSNSGSYNNNYNNTNGSFYRPNSSGNVNSEIPVGNFSSGNSSPVVPTIPSGVVPAR